jgi:hypothetical protein
MKYNMTYMENHNEHETPKYLTAYFEAEKYLRRLGYDPNISDEEEGEEEVLEEEYLIEDVVKDLDGLASRGDSFAAELKERILEGAKEDGVSIKWE